MEESFALSMGTTSAVVAKAKKMLPDATRYATRQGIAGSKRCAVMLFHKEHGIAEFDRIDYYFVAVKAEDPKDPRVTHLWEFQTTKVRTTMPGHTMEDYGLPEIREMKPRKGALSPGAAKLVKEYNLNYREIDGSGKGGKIMKKDVVVFMEEEMDIIITTSVSEPTVKNEKKKSTIQKAVEGA